MSTRLSHRRDIERLEWTLRGYIKSPQLVSHRATALPMKIKGKDVGIRQAVVKIVSFQRLQRGELRSSRLRSGGTRGGNEFWRYEEEDVQWEAKLEKVVTEYVVLQTMLIDGEEQPWKIWGFAEETKVDALKGFTGGTESDAEKSAGGAQATATATNL